MSGISTRRGGMADQLAVLLFIDNGAAPVTTGDPALYRVGSDLIYRDASAVEHVLGAAVSAAEVIDALADAATSIDVNAQKIVGLAAGTDPGDALRWEQGGMLAVGGSGASADTLGAATKYLPRSGNVAAAQVSVGVATRAGILRNLRVGLNVAPGGADTVIFTAQKSSDQGATWTDTTLTATITGSAKSASDTTHAPAVAAGDWVAVKMVSSAGTAAGPVGGLEIL